MDAYLVRRLQALSKTWQEKADLLEKGCGATEPASFTLRSCSAQLFMVVQSAALDEKRAKAVQNAVMKTNI